MTMSPAIMMPCCWSKVACHDGPFWPHQTKFSFYSEYSGEIACMVLDSWDLLGYFLESFVYACSFPFVIRNNWGFTTIHSYYDQHPFGKSLWNWWNREALKISPEMPDPPLWPKEQRHHVATIGHYELSNTRLQTIWIFFCDCNLQMDKSRKPLIHCTYKRCQTLTEASKNLVTYVC